MSSQQLLIAAILALGALQAVSAWSTARATFYGKDGW
jgi:hypothetical protein